VIFIFDSPSIDVASIMLTIDRTVKHFFHPLFKLTNLKLISFDAMQPSFISKAVKI
jgi:hypothetical protein